MRLDLGRKHNETAADLLEQAQALLDAHMNVDAEKAAGALVDSKSPDVRCKALNPRVGATKA